MKQNPGIGAGGLAEREGVSRPRVSKVVQELVAAGLLVGERGSDRRRVGLELTPAGHAVLKSIRRRRNAWLASRLRMLDPEDVEQLEAAIPLLAKLLEAPK